MSLRQPIVLALLLLAPVLRAQTDPLVEALRHFQAGDLVRAREQVDRAVRTPAHEKDPEAWLLRGFIYKDVFKGTRTEADADRSRDEALNSLLICLELDAEGTYRENATQAYDFLTRTCYNDAAKALADQREGRAMELFRKYKDAVLRADPGAQLKAREVEFLNALGTAYTKRYNQDRNVEDWFDAGVEAFKGVLEIDPSNYGANYNLATLYYNRGVYNIRRISAADDIPSIEQIQLASRDYFIQALPYMLKAHDMNPGRRETLLGLEGIYYSLQDQENSDKYRRLFEELPPQEER
jgi:Flp pilus assembly protein TadD